MREDRRYIFYSVLLVWSTLLTGSINYLYHFIVVRYLSPAEYGLLYSVFTFIMIISAVTFTLQTSVAKKIANLTGLGKEVNIRYLTWRLIKHMLVLAVMVDTAVLVCSPFLKAVYKMPDMSPVVFIMVSVICAFLLPIATGIASGLKEFVVTSASQTASVLVRVGATLLMCVLGWGIYGAYGGTVLSALTPTAIILAWITFRYKPLEHHENVALRDVYTFAVPVLAASVGFTLFTWVDVTIVRYYFTEEMSGFYSVANMIARGYLYIGLALSTVILPYVSEMAVKGQSPLKLLFKNLGFMAIIGSAGTVFLNFTGPAILSFIISRKGASYDIGAIQRMLMLLSAPCVMLGMLSILYNYCLGLHKRRHILILYSGLVLLAGLCWLRHATVDQVIINLYWTFGLCCGVYCVYVVRLKMPGSTA